MSKRILILDVDSDKYDALVDALGKRPYLRVVPMDRSGRKLLSDCPCCRRKLSKESTFVINDLMVDSLIRVLAKMALSKSVILVNKDHPASSVPPIQAELCVEVDPVTIFRAESLGLLSQFIDGSTITYFVTAKGVDFLSGTSPASPSTLITLDGDVVEMTGQIAIEEVKFKDFIKSSEAIRMAGKAIRSLPENVVNFITNGQMSLI